ncbi:MAG: metallophosphoesterase [Methanoregulaceae archaeon]|nr:metallophosphoesterase [Methanoregulaceae archaeon]
MRMDFIEGGPALVVKNTMDVLVIADLHLGIESDLERHGIHFRSRSAGRQEQVISCIEGADPDLLVLLGDVKHNVPMTSRQEFRELPGIFSSFRRLVEMRVFPGNHDTGIDRFLSPEELMPAEGAVIDGTGYLHGHTCPSPSLSGHLICAGHHHPHIALQDEVGCSLRAPAYLLADLSAECFGASPPAGRTRVLFLPAMNEFSGYDIRRILRDPFSPLSRCVVKETAEVILSDGTYIGLPDTLEDT